MSNQVNNPYQKYNRPVPKPGTPAAKREAAALRHGGDAPDDYYIPPERRKTVPGCSKFCRTCEFFVQNPSGGGGCPGVYCGGSEKNDTEPPACYVDAKTGHADWPCRPAGKGAGV